MVRNTHKTELQCNLEAAVINIIKHTGNETEVNRVLVFKIIQE